MILEAFPNLNSFIILKRKIVTSRCLGIEMKWGWIVEIRLKTSKSPPSLH